jgi:hypothetical protein
MEEWKTFFLEIMISSQIIVEKIILTILLVDSTPHLAFSEV